MKWESAPERGVADWLTPDAVGMALVFAVLVVAVVAFARHRRKDQQSKVAVDARRNAGAVAKPCAWVRSEVQHSRVFDIWACATCRVEAFTSDGMPPKECEKVLKAAL